MSVAHPTTGFDPAAASAYDLWLEQLAEESDPWAGPAESWPRFWDDERWTLGPDGRDDDQGDDEPDRGDDDTGEFEPPPPADEPETFEPAPEDAAWVATLPPICGGAPDGPTDADYDDAARIATWQDRLEASHAVTDMDIRAAGLAVG